MTHDEELLEVAAELANKPFAQADALRELADALDRGELLPLDIARPLIARMAKREMWLRAFRSVVDAHEEIFAELAKND